MPLAQLPNYSSSVIPQRAIRTPTGLGSNRPSPRATQPCASCIVLGRPAALLADLFVVFSFSPTPSLPGGSGAPCKRTTEHDRRWHVPVDSRFNPLRLARNSRWVARLVYRTASLFAFVLLLMRPWVMQACHPTASGPGNRAHPAYARTFLLVDWYEHLHPVAATQLLEVSSAENLAADSPVAPHHDTLARRARHRRQRRLLRPSSGDASRYHLHLAFR